MTGDLFHFQKVFFFFGPNLQYSVFIFKNVSIMPAYSLYIRATRVTEAVLEKKKVP